MKRWKYSFDYNQISELNKPNQTNVYIARGVMTTVLDSGLKLSEFEIQSRHYIH